MGRQLEWQPSPSATLPSSQVSPAKPLVVLSPQEGSVQSGSQPAEPSGTASQASPAVGIELPQPVTVQLESQPSPSIALPSSQSSPLVTTVLPQAVIVQLLSQPSPSVKLPSSQTSPAVTMVFPQAVRLQLESQPSPSTRLESSHCSPRSGIPSPQMASARLARNNKANTTEQATIAKRRILMGGDSFQDWAQRFHMRWQSLSRESTAIAEVVSGGFCVGQNLHGAEQWLCQKNAHLAQMEVSRDCKFCVHALLGHRFS